MPRPPLFTLWKAGELFYCSFSYSPQLVDFIKDTIPSRQRRWDKDSRAWSFTQEYAASVLTEARRLGFTCRIEGIDEDARRDTPPPRPVYRNADETIVAFFRLLPPDALKAAYRAAAFKLHPDHGGDEQSMKELNELWQLLEKELLTGVH
jgi:hypothetical protein